MSVYFKSKEIKELRSLKLISLLYVTLRKSTCYIRVRRESSGVSDIKTGLRDKATSPLFNYQKQSIKQRGVCFVKKKKLEPQSVRLFRQSVHINE